MALYLLNISVDTADSTPHYLPEDLTFNDQESIVEIVLEKILGFEDAIAECDDNDKCDLNKNNLTNVVFVIADNIKQDSNYWHDDRIKQFPLCSIMISRFESAPDSPPPELHLFL
jgi:hypothetical protein